MCKREPKYLVGTRVRVVNERHRNDEVGYVSKVKSRKVLNDVTGYTYHIQFKSGAVSSFSEANIREELYTTRLKKIETAEFSPEVVKSIGAISTVFTEAGSDAFESCKETAQLFQIRETTREDVTNEYFIDWFLKLDNWVTVGPEQFPFDLLIHSDEVPVYGCFYGGMLDAIIRVDEYRADCEISFLAAARARGRLGGRPKVTSDKSVMALKMYGSKEFTVDEICKNCNIGKTTLYRLLKGSTDLPEGCNK